jgi:hypothetical protein
MRGAGISVKVIFHGNLAALLHITVVADQTITRLVALSLTPTYSEKGVAKRAKKKENPFKRSLKKRKEFLVMTHDSVAESMRQWPVPSEQQMVSSIAQQSLTLVSSAKRR